jgi:hypothetical protein
VVHDPGEKTDLAKTHPDRTRDLLGRLLAYAEVAVPAKGAGGGGKPAGFKAPAVWGQEE